MANVVDADTGRPLGGARPSMLLEWGGVRLGLMGEFLPGCDAMLFGAWLGIVVTGCCWRPGGWESQKDGCLFRS